MPGKNNPTIRDLPRNVWAVSFASFFMDISSEMVINILPLFLSNVLGVKTSIIGIIEGVAEATSSILKLFSGWLSDRLQSRKWLAAFGYGISAISKPFFMIANTWGIVAGVRWIDRVGKGVRTAPRDALVADSINEDMRGLAFGFHRAADTAGAVVGILAAMGIVWFAQANANTLNISTFHTIVIVSIIPAFLAVLSIITGTRETVTNTQRKPPKFSLVALGRPFIVFVVIVSIFQLGNSSDAFLVLRAQDRGMSVFGILGMLMVFNVLYTLVSTPAGSLSDRIGRRKLIIGGWTVYALIYLGFGLAQTAVHIWVMYVLYGLYYGMAYGTANALVADLVPVDLRGTAYGTYNAILGIMSFPASLIAGILWQGVGNWQGFGASAPFFFGAGAALLATILLVLWMPKIEQNKPVG